MFHPAYQPTNLNYDVALLELESDLKYDNHIGPICIDNPDLEASASSNCVTTGWGKNVLKGKLFCKLLKLRVELGPGLYGESRATKQTKVSVKTKKA
jgi:hypothetical protein